MAKLLRPDGQHSEITPGDGATFTLAELQHFVGGFIECIELPDGTILIINEEGNIMRMAHNPAASEAAGVRIVGPALICEPGEIE